MSYKTILVHLDASERAPYRLEVALLLANRFKAHLNAIYALYKPEPVLLPAFPETAVFFESGRTLHIECRHSLKRLFHAGLARLSLSGDWIEDSGHARHTVPMHGRVADLVVAGQYDSNDPESFISKNFAETLVVNTGRPILFLPYSGVFQDVGRHVLIGWNASQYATRSIHDAMPFLRQARQVEIARVRGRGDPMPEIHGPGTDIGTTLARNEVRATLRDIVEHVDRPICDVLLSEAQRIGADLIAMGGYGHTRWRDVVLGGVTRDMLCAMPLPVLMSH